MRKTVTAAHILVSQPRLAQEDLKEVKVMEDHTSPQSECILLFHSSNSAKSWPVGVIVIISAHIKKERKRKNKKKSIFVLSVTYCRGIPFHGIRVCETAPSINPTANTVGAIPRVKPRRNEPSQKADSLQTETAATSDASRTRNRSDIPRGHMTGTWLI